MKDIFLGLVLLSALAAVQCLRTNLSLFEISPCGGDNFQTVSRFKSDIYAIKPSFEKCKNYSWWQEGSIYNKTVSLWENKCSENLFFFLQLPAGWMETP